MERMLKIRGRELRFEELEDLAAVYAEEPEWAARVRSGEFGTVIGAAAPGSRKMTRRPLARTASRSKRRAGSF